MIRTLLPAALGLLGAIAHADDLPLAIPVGGAPTAAPQGEEGPLAIPGNANGAPQSYAPPAPPPPPAPLAALAPHLTYNQGYQDGKDTARHKSVLDWAAVGAGGACLGNAFGCLGATAAGGLLTPNPPTVYFQGLNNTDPTDNDYWNGYREGYDRTLRGRRAGAAFIAGGAVSGVAILVVGAVLIAESAAVYHPYPGPGY